MFSYKFLTKEWRASEHKAKDICAQASTDNAQYAQIYCLGKTVVKWKMVG